jgi:long-chain acyl-CoA synthetase
MLLPKHVVLELLPIVTMGLILYLFISFYLCSEYDITNGHVGHPIISCEVRLIDWDEGQYKPTDKPNPRGEILIGGKAVSKGYYGQASNENIHFKEIDGTRYFCTGDIGEVFPDGTLRIVG